MADPRKKQVSSLRNANQVYFDSAISHQIGVRQFSAGEAKKINHLISLADAELVRLLRNRLPQFQGRSVDFTSRRYISLLTDLRLKRNELMREIRNAVRPELLELAKLESNFEKRILESAIPIELSLATVPFITLSAIVNESPFDGRLLKDWFKGLQQTDQARLTRAINVGLTLQESVDDMVRRVAGTRRNGYRDGVLAITRRNAESVVRTAVNHVSNAAREKMWEANSDIIAGLRWTATLDGRTTAICRSRDGKIAPIGDKPIPKGYELLSPPGARPPAHMNCRSVMVAVVDGVGILGDRPFVVDTRTPDRRKVDFRKIAAQTGRSIQDVRREWAIRNIGTIPAVTNYDQWLRTTPVDFQDEVLGKVKGRLFRGGLKLDEYVDKQGSELTIKQLARTNPDAFASANLKVENFI